MKTLTLAILAVAALATTANAADFGYPQRHAYRVHRSILAHPYAEPVYATPAYAAPAPAYSEPTYSVLNPFGVVGAALQVPIVVLQGTQSVFVPRAYGAAYRPYPY